MADTLAETCEHYDYVIIDSAPIGPVADSLALSSIVEAVIVVSWDKNPKQMTGRVCPRLRQIPRESRESFLTASNALTRAMDMALVPTVAIPKLRVSRGMETVATAMTRPIATRCLAEVIRFDCAYKTIRRGFSIV